MCATLLAAAALSSGCGGDNDGSEGGLAKLTPPDAPLYFEATLRPSSDQAGAIAAFASRLGLDDPGAAIAALADESLADSGLPISYSEDVEPWLGGDGAVFVRSFDSSNELDVPDFALLLEAEDEEAAKALVDDTTASSPQTTEERSYGGYGYAFEGDAAGGVALALIDDVFFIGTEASFKVAVDSKQGESLAGSDEYAKAVEAIGGDPLATLMIEPETAIEAAIASGEIGSDEAELIRPLLTGPLSEAVFAGLSVNDASLALDFAIPTMETVAANADAELIERLPAESWAAIGVPDLGPALERTLDQLSRSGLPGANSLEAAVQAETGLDLADDVTSWLGDGAAYVAGTSPDSIEVGLRAETTDPEGPAELLGAARELILRERPQARIGEPPEGAEEGFSVSAPGGASLEAGVVDGELLVVLGRAAADLLAPAQTLADADGFRAGAEALGDEFEASAYLDLPALFLLAEAGGADDRSYAAAEPYLDRLSYAVAGTRFDDGLAISRVAVGLPSE